MENYFHSSKTSPMGFLAMNNIAFFVSAVEKPDCNKLYILFHPGL